MRSTPRRRVLRIAVLFDIKESQIQIPHFIRRLQNQSFGVKKEVNREPPVLSECDYLRLSGLYLSMILGEKSV